MRKLVIDADMLVYRSLITNFRELQLVGLDGRTHIHYMTDYSSAFKMFNTRLNKLESLFSCSSILCFSDLMNNWRHDVMPTYKGNRANLVNLAGRYQLTEQLKTIYDSYSIPFLEADDCIGLLVTSNYQDEFIVVSIDKDFNSIPCRFYNYDRDLMTVIIPEEADTYFYAQALAGDTADNYKGCKGIGLQKALELIKDGVAYRYNYTKKKWVKTKALSRWHTVLTTYLKHGYSKLHALTQLRVARILRDGDYNFNNQQVIPFTPFESEAMRIDL